MVTVDDRQLAIVDLGSVVSRDVRKLIGRNILTHGEPFRSGGVLGTSCLPVLGAGSTAASSLFAGNVFLATANPATLMAMNGVGVGSAVMGPTGIVAQAPFIAASTAIVPVIAPVMFFMTVSSMMMSVRFDRLQSSLDRLAELVKQLLKRELAEDFAQVLSAVARLQDISAEFDESRRFTDEMRIRLALVERDVGTIQHKYDILIGEPLSRNEELPNLASVALKMNMAPVDQHLYALSGVASVYIDRQRLRLALQDNPDDVGRSAAALNAKIQATRQGFVKLLESNPLVQYHDELRHSLDEMSWWERNVSQRSQTETLEGATALAANVRADSLAPVLNSMQSWSDALGESEDEGLTQSVIYYREEDGKGDLKAYYTGDLRLQPRPQDATQTSG